MAAPAAVDDPHPVRDVGGLDHRLVQRADPPEPADVGLADGDQSGDGVHPAGRQLRRRCRRPAGRRSRRRAARGRPAGPRPVRRRSWPRRCGADPATASSSRTVSCPGSPMMLRAAATVDSASRVVPAPRMSAASIAAVLAGGDQQGPGLFRSFAAVDGRGRERARLGRLDSRGVPSPPVPPRRARAAGGGCSAGPVGCSRFCAAQTVRPGQRAGKQEDHGGDGGGADQDLAAPARRGGPLGGVEQSFGPDQGGSEQRERRPRTRRGR